MCPHQGLTSTRYHTLPGFFLTTRTLPRIFLKISGFRVVSKYHFQCRIISMTLISQGKWPFTRLINFQNFPHPSDMKTFVTKWSMEFPQQLNTTIIIWRSAPTSPDILVLVMMMAITILLICKILMDSRDLRYPQPYPLPGIFPTTLPEPYPKSKSPTRQSLLPGPFLYFSNSRDQGLTSRAFWLRVGFG